MWSRGGGSAISRKCMWLWTHLCIPGVVMYPFCLGILESVEYCVSSAFPVAVSLQCVIMRLVASISLLRHCTVGYLIAWRVPVLLPQGSLLVTRRVFGKVTCSRFICTVDVL